MTRTEEATFLSTRSILSGGIDSWILFSTLLTLSIEASRRNRGCRFFKMRTHPFCLGRNLDDVGESATRRRIRTRGGLESKTNLYALPDRDAIHKRVGHSQSAKRDNLNSPFKPRHFFQLAAPDIAAFPVQTNLKSVT
jgi:hypothetical protein